MNISKKKFSWEVLGSKHQHGCLPDEYRIGQQAPALRTWAQGTFRKILKVEAFATRYRQKWSQRLLIFYLRNMLFLSGSSLEIYVAVLLCYCKH